MNCEASYGRHEFVVNFQLYLQTCSVIIKISTKASDISQVIILALNIIVGQSALVLKTILV